MLCMYRNKLRGERVLLLLVKFSVLDSNTTMNKCNKLWNHNSYKFKKSQSPPANNLR